MGQKKKNPLIATILADGANQRAESTKAPGEMLSRPNYGTDSGASRPGKRTATQRASKAETVDQPGFLGSNAKYSAARPIDPETGEVSSTKKTAAMLRCERFAMQSGVRKLLPESRTAKCLRLRQKGQEVQVIRSKEHKRCSYHGLQTCSSVWACPVCAAKISERRRVELKTAIDAHVLSGGGVYLLTLTNPHHFGDDLGELLAGQAKALSYFNGDRASRKLFAEMGCIGQIRALEATHGRLRDVNNGWHPHYHILLFAAASLDLKDFELRLAGRWMTACAKAGLKLPSIEHGVRLDSGKYAAKYAAKWGLDHEMTKGHIKKATDGESPFDLLRAYTENDDKQAGALFVEFANSFKGKRQLHWSPGLKKHFQIGEMTDEELAAKQDDRAALLGKLTLEQWRYILKKDARAIVLDLAEQGWEAVARFLAAMPAELAPSVETARAAGEISRLVSEGGSAQRVQLSAFRRKLVEAVDPHGTGFSVGQTAQAISLGGSQPAGPS